MIIAHLYGSLRSTPGGERLYTVRLGTDVRVPDVISIDGDRFAFGSFDGETAIATYYGLPPECHDYNPAEEDITVL